ncbi:hypothetical protein DY000_02044482 [Brassica cretica]|uniref:Uncharacterized protein n=1 Tax=Brassica cretica TaxID=69181 RepID=A0ABQ7EU22_BRACR|nr:hypothetical protein DY000_02044482 [Brassica cretica]
MMGGRGFDCGTVSEWLMGKWTKVSVAPGKFKGAEFPELGTVDLEKPVDEGAGPVNLKPAAVLGVEDFVAGLVDLAVQGFDSVPSCGISLLALLPLLVKRSGFLFLMPRKKSIFLESYYSDLSNTVIGRPQATLQIDHRLQCTCPEKAQTTMKSLFNSLLFSDSLKSRGDTKRLCDKGSGWKGSRGRSLTRTSTIICQRDWDSPSNAKEVDEENQPSLVEKDKSCKRLFE